MFELTVARRHISSDPRMVLFALLSVSLSISVIVIMMGLMEGYREDIIRSTVENNPHLTVEPKEDEDYISLYRTLSGLLYSYPQVEAVSPRILGKAGAKYKDRVRGVSIIGADPYSEESLMRVQQDMVWGSYFDLVFRRRGAVVGTKLAEDLKLRPDDQFSLVRQNRSIKVKVVGIIQTGTGADQTLVYLPLKTAQELLNRSNVVSEVGARLSSIYSAPAVVKDINSRTRYRAQSWEDQNRDILSVLDTQKTVMILFYLLIFIIAGMGVANTMIMTVTRRTREIGILMAMGATRRSIVKIFLAESLILGPPAAAFGCGLAYLTAKLIEAYPIEVPSDIYLVSRFTVLLTPESFAYAVLFSLSINFLAGLYPAYRASKLDPVEAIASE